MRDFIFILVTIAAFVVLALIARGGGEAVSAENLIGLILSICVAAYLVVALLFPEKF